MTAPRRRLPRGEFDGLMGRRMLRAIAAHTVEGGPDGECWDWTGGYSTRKGVRTYPLLSMKVGGKSRPLRTYRVAYEAAFGPIPPGEQVHHRCGRSSCVRPEHLQTSTSRENTAEMLARRALEKRIFVLEAALREFRPDHPALDD